MMPLHLWHCFMELPPTQLCFSIMLKLGVCVGGAVLNDLWTLMNGLQNSGALA